MRAWTRHNPAGRWTPAPLLILAAAALLAGGCATPTYTDYEAFITEPRPVVVAEEYRMAPPDVVYITSRRVREIHGHREAIRPDGRITLPLLGTVKVAGRTPEEVSEELEEMASEYYEDARVSLRVEEFHSKKIYVFGEVRSAGPYPFDGANSVLETLAMAQPTRLANPRHVQVLRPNSDGELRKRMTVNLDDMVRTGDTSLDAVLREGDIIYVPPNGLASVGLALQQLLLPINPAASTARGINDIDRYSNSPSYGTGR